MKNELKSLWLNPQTRNSILYALGLSAVLSLVFVSNGYYSTEDFTYFNEMFDGSANKTFVDTCIYDGKYTLYFLFKALCALKLNDTLSLSFLYLMGFKLQLIVAGILILKHLGISLKMIPTIICLSLFGFYPYLVEPTLYKHYFGFQSASLCYFFAIIGVVELREKRIPVFASIGMLVLSFGVYQTMMNLSLCALCVFTFVDLINSETSSSKQIIRAFFINIGYIALAGIAYLLLSKLFVSVYSVSEVSRVSFLSSVDQLVQLFKSIGLALARAFTQGVGNFNVVDRIAFLAVLGLAIRYSFKKSALAFVFLWVSVLSNFAIFFVINPEVGSILPRTLTSLALFTFVMVAWTWSENQYTGNKFFYAITIVMLISYVSVWYTVLENNKINKQRDFALANAMLNDIYRIDNFRQKQIFYQIGSESVYELENRRSALLAAQTNFSSYNNDQNFPHQLLRFVSGLNLNKVADINTQTELRNKYPYSQHKEAGKRFNILVFDTFIIVYL